MSLIFSERRITDAFQRYSYPRAFLVLCHLGDPKFLLALGRSESGKGRHVPDPMLEH